MGNFVKIVVFGALNAGKTTFLERASKKKLSMKGSYEGMTTSLDFTQLKYNGKTVHLFTTPGHRRFDFMWEVLAKGMNGAILLIDSTVGITEVDREIGGLIESKGVPYVVAVNKSDLANLSLEIVREGLGISAKVPVIPTSAIYGKGVEEVFHRLMELENERRGTEQGIE
ncbi:MAG TPA: GTP-binding protein [Candidatus Bathyarchaeia archaeon]|nr:GTP-binding protein [Candidatus Bathyarchaeia archaeon]